MKPLRQFQGTATIKQTREQRQRLESFVAERYAAGYSLRQIAELTDRSQTAIRRVLRELRITPRGRGAPYLGRTRGSASVTPAVANSEPAPHAGHSWPGEEME